MPVRRSGGVGRMNLVMRRTSTHPRCQAPPPSLSNLRLPEDITIEIPSNAAIYDLRITRDDVAETEARHWFPRLFMNSIITNHDYTLDLLEDIIQQAAPVQTDLIVCSTKEDFVSQILAELHRHHLEQLSPETSLEDDEKDEEDESSASDPTHILLSKALHVLNSSQHVKLIFCPTITIFRGFLSSYVARSTIASQPHGPIVILNLLAMHHGTSEFTLQGISQTLATAVSAAHRTGRSLRLVECKDISDPANPNRGSALWQAEVQLLSAAIKIGEAGQDWGRRTISVTKIASRWFEVDENKQAHEAKRRAAAREIMSEEEMVG